MLKSQPESAQEMITCPAFLILDDDEGIRYLESHALLKEFPDCRVVGCSTVAGALAEAQGTRFDGILTDHHLGQSDGAEFVHALRTAGITCPVVMVTGSIDPKVIERALHNGATRVFSGGDTEFVGFFRKVLGPARSESAGGCS